MLINEAKQVFLSQRECHSPHLKTTDTFSIILTLYLNKQVSVHIFLNICTLLQCLLYRISSINQKDKGNNILLKISSPTTILLVSEVLGSLADHFLKHELPVNMNSFSMQRFILYICNLDQLDKDVKEATSVCHVYC